MLLDISFSWVLLAIVVGWLIIVTISLIMLYRRTDILLPVKIFWMVVIFIAPVIGLIFYWLFGAKKRLSNPGNRVTPRR